MYLPVEPGRLIGDALYCKCAANELQLDVIASEGKST